jgi:hypothetical protein
LNFGSFHDGAFIPNNPLDQKLRHTGAGRYPARKTTCEAVKTLMLTHWRGGFLIIWIPACAGMTA